MIDYDHASDEQLVEMTKNKNDVAFQVLVKRYLSYIFNFARQYAKTVEDTEDIVQESFFKVWRSIHLFEKNRVFRPWLFMITRNTALDHIKKKRPILFSELDNDDEDINFADTLDDPEPLPDELFDRAQLRDELDQAMSHLHPDHRAVLQMHYKDGMTFDEIAIVMNKPMNTVKSWHRRSLTKVRTNLLHQR